MYSYKSIATAPTIKAAMPFANGEVEPFLDLLPASAEEVLFIEADVEIDVEVIWLKDEVTVVVLAIVGEVAVAEAEVSPPDRKDSTNGCSLVEYQGILWTM